MATVEPVATEVEVEAARTEHRKASDRYHRECAVLQALDRGMSESTYVAGGSALVANAENAAKDAYQEMTAARSRWEDLGWRREQALEAGKDR